MKHLLALMALCVAFAAGAQVSNDTYDPDADGDNNIGVNDLLALLSLFGENDVDDDGIWDSVDDCVADSCTKRAYLIIEPNALGAQIGTYMYYNGATQWFGYSNGSFPAVGNTSDMALYLSFWDQYAGTDEVLWADYDGDGIEDAEEFDGILVPPIFTSNVPQTDGGFDAFGNPKLKYWFETFEVPFNFVEGGFHWVIFIADEAMGGPEYSHRVSGVGLGGNPSACSSQLTIFPGGSSWTTEFEGSQIPNGEYRICKADVTLDVESMSWFIRCSGIAEVE